MGILSKLNPWRGQPADVLLFCKQPEGSVEREQTLRIAAQLTAGETLTCEIASSLKRPRNPIIHFFDAQTAANATFETKSHAPRIVVNVNSRDVFHQDTINGLASIDSPIVIADCSATATWIRRNHRSARAVVIHEGIDATAFRQSRINTRFAARRTLGIPANALCVGISQNTKGVIDEVVMDYLTCLTTKLGPTTLLCLSSQLPDSSLQFDLQEAGIAVVMTTPKSVEELQTYFDALDLYMNVGAIGNLRGILRSWATGIPIASLPNRIAEDILHDSLTAAIAESATGAALAEVAAELHTNEEVRHGCRERGRAAVQNFSWTQVLDKYEEVYQQLLGRTIAA